MQDLPPTRFLSMHKDHTLEELQLIKNKTFGQLDCSTDLEVKKIKRKINSVCNQIHRLSAFIRLTPEKNILHGFADPTHDIGLHLVCRLARRTKDKLIIIGNKKESYLAIYDGSKIQCTKDSTPYPKILKNYNLENKSTNIKQIWQEYYWSQYAQNRQNPKYFRSNVPLNILGKTETELKDSDPIKKNNKKLTDFL